MKCPSPFTFSSKMPINTEVWEVKGASWPFTHPSPPFTSQPIFENDMVKGGEGLTTYPSPAETPCISAFQSKRWRVKGIRAYSLEKIDSSTFSLTKGNSELSAISTVRCFYCDRLLFDFWQQAVWPTLTYCLTNTNLLFGFHLSTVSVWQLTCIRINQV